MLSRLLNTHPEIGCLTEVPLSSFFERIEPLFSESDAHDTLFGIAQGALLTTARAGSAEAVRPAPDASPEVPPLAPRGDERTAAPAAPADPVPMQRQSSEKRWQAWVYSNRREDELAGLGVVDPHMFLQPARHGSRIARALVEIALDKEKLVCLGSKVPNLDPVALADELSAQTPNLRLIHIVRRPSDVVNSSLARRNDTREAVDMWHIDTVEDACNEWRIDWNRVSRARRLLGDRLLVVRYEDVVAGRQETIEGIARHLGVAAAFDLRLCRPLPTELRGYACTAEDEAVIGSLLGGINAAWDDPLDDLFERFPYLATALPADGAIRFGLGQHGHTFASEGLSGAEPWGCWTDGEVVRFDIGLGRTPGDLRLTFSSHLWRLEWDRAFDVVVSAGRARQVVTIPPGEPFQVYETSVDIPRRALDDPTLLPLTLRIARTKSAEEEPVGDPRRLGLGLRGIDVSFVTA